MSDKRPKGNDLFDTITIIIVCIITMVAVIVVDGMEEEKEEQDFEPTPLTIETTDITESEDFKKAVSTEAHNILNDEITLTVYADGAEDFCYHGRVELANDGSDGTEVMLFIYADSKTMLDEVF